MYTVYADDQLIYSPDFITDGRAITDPTLEKEANKSGTFRFNIYTTNPCYNAIKPLKTIVYIKDGTEEIWRGRVLSYQNNFENCKSVSCEGIQSYFVDSIIRPYERTCGMADQFRYYISQHNAQVESYKQFTVKSITVDDIYGSKEWKSDTYERTTDAIDKIVDDYGGYLVVTYENGQNMISYLKNPGNQNTNQVINFGENLMDITQSVDPSNVFTILIPVAYDSNNNKVTIESVNEGKDYLESAEGIDKFGRIFYQHTFEDPIETPTALKEKATNFLAENIKNYYTISVKALDLHLLNPSIDRLNIYDILKIISKPHGIEELEMCTKITLRFDSPENNEYLIGTIPEGILSTINENK